MKYKVGDRVRIKSLDWYNENKNEFDEVKCGKTNFIPDMVKYCNKIVTISSTLSILKVYYIKENGCPFYWTDEMIEGLVEEEMSLDKAGQITDFEYEGLAYTLPEGYQFKDENGNVINAMKIVLEKNIIREEQIDNAAQEYIDSDNAVLTYSDGFCEQTDHPFVRAAFKAGVEWADNNVTQDDCSKAPKLTSQDYSNGRFGYQLPAGFKAKLTERELILTPEKPEYPKSLLDCENVLNGIRNDRKKLLHKFNELLIYRDAYWKLYGEEMGLGKPWEPDWKNSEERRYCIVNIEGDINLPEKILTKWILKVTNKIFVFPTEEMRDMFYEHFKDEIEICKELL